MINRVTGEIGFQSGLHIIPHSSVHALSANVNVEGSMNTVTQKLSLKGWQRHVLGFHPSEHGTFEVEALSTEERIHVVLLAHQHPFYKPGTSDDAERRAFHEGVISSDLAGQKEFTWGEVICRLESPLNKDWIVVAYSREAKIPLQVKDTLLHLHAREIMPKDNN